MDAITVVDVDIDVKDARVVPKQLQYAQNDVVDITKPTRFPLLCVM